MQLSKMDGFMREEIKTNKKDNAFQIGRVKETQLKISEKIKEFSKWKSDHSKDYGKLKKRTEWIYERTVKDE